MFFSIYRDCSRAIAVALAQRLAVLHVVEKSDNDDSSGADINVVPHFFAPAISPETVTAIAWIVNESVAHDGLHQLPLHSELLALEDSLILVGTSLGFLQLHTVDGSLLYRQELHHSAVMSIEVRGKGYSIDPDDSSEDVTIMFENAVCRLSMVEILGICARCGRAFASGEKNVLDSIETVAKWNFRGNVGSRYGGSFVGPAPSSLYSILSGRKEMSRLLLFTIGAHPPLATFEVQDGPVSGGVLSLVGNLALNSASAVLTRAKGLLHLPRLSGSSSKATSNASTSQPQKRGYGFGATDTLHANQRRTIQSNYNVFTEGEDTSARSARGAEASATRRQKDSVTGISISAVSTVWDDKRHVVSLSFSPW